MNERDRAVIEEFRANEGRPPSRAHMSLLLLTTTGARSGERRTTPVAYITEGDVMYVFASKGGAPVHPAWYHNLLANPVVTVELGNETFEARAESLQGAERDRVYAIQSQRSPVFAEYQAKTERIIPVVALHRLR